MADHPEVGFSENQIAAECCGHVLGIAYGLTETLITPVVQQH